MKEGSSTSEVTTDPESTPSGSCAFPSDPAAESNICEKLGLGPESLFDFPEQEFVWFSYMAFLNKNIAEFQLHHWQSVGSRSLNRSWILEFENFSDPDSNIWNRSGLGV